MQSITQSWTIVNSQGNDIPEAFGLYPTEEQAIAVALDLFKVEGDELPEGIDVIRIQQ